MMTMRFAVTVPNFGDFADPEAVADLARRAEEAGRHGLFIWDHLTEQKRLPREIGSSCVRRVAAAGKPAG